MSMDTLELVRRLLVAGVAVDLTDHGTIRLSGHPIPDDLLAELKAHKAAVLELMTTQRLGEVDDGFASAVPRRFVVPATCMARRACARLGPCSHFLTRQSCNPAERVSSILSTKVSAA
jgi:hypothetical protein